MSLIVACPSCQTRYNLPEKFAGKKVKCKSCGKPFAATVGAAKAKAVTPNKNVSQKQVVDPQELSNMGIGLIKQQPDPFGAQPQLGPDPLRNHVVQDPGFGIPGQAVPGMQTDEDNTELDPDFESVVANPYIRAPKAPAHAAAAEPETEVDGTGKKKKKRKKKVHPAVKDSLDRATMTLLIVGVLIAMLFGFFFISAKSDALTNLRNINKFNVDAGDPGWTDAQMEEFATEEAASRRIGTGIGVFIGVGFMILGAGVQIFPITCSIIGLVGYILFEIVFSLALLDIFSLSGWLRRIVVCGALGKAFMDAMNARYYDQMMKERRQSGR